MQLAVARMQPVAAARTRIVPALAPEPRRSIDWLSSYRWRTLGIAYPPCEPNNGRLGSRENAQGMNVWDSEHSIRGSRSKEWWCHEYNRAGKRFVNRLFRQLELETMIITGLASESVHSTSTSDHRRPIRRIVWRSSVKCVKEKTHSTQRYWWYDSQHQHC